MRFASGGPDRRSVRTSAPQARLRPLRALLSLVVSTTLVACGVAAPTPVSSTPAASDLVVASPAAVPSLIASGPPTLSAPSPSHADSSNASTRPTASPTRASGGINLDARLVDAHGGWAVTAKRVARTSDDDRTWSDVTPDGLAIAYQARDPNNESVEHSNVLGADFRNALDAHLATATWATGALTMTVWSTNDGGSTWSRSALPAVKDDFPVLPNEPTPDAWAVSLAFPDQEHGYALLHFDRGGLYGPGPVLPAFAFRTIDGGRDWTPLPRGAWAQSFAFSGPQRGWSGDAHEFSTTGDGERPGLR